MFSFVLLDVSIDERTQTIILKLTRQQNLSSMASTKICDLINVDLG
jgi:hypothetical protein